MPFTPFHMGPGIAVKAVLGSRFSLTVFGFTLVLIDLEPAYWMLKQAWPVHRTNHTVLGAMVIAVIAVVVGKPLCSGILGAWNKRLHPDQKRMLGVDSQISWSVATISGVIGSLSHVALDALMHSDMEPFSPVWDGNPALGLISHQQLYMGCVVAGAVGLVGLFGQAHTQQGTGSMIQSRKQ
jgi:hypothetical protein